MTASKTIKFRDYQFTVRGAFVSVTDLAYLYLIFRAMDGDKLAAELLNASGLTLQDDNKKQLWPKKEGTE